MTATTKTPNPQQPARRDLAPRGDLPHDQQACACATTDDCECDDCDCPICYPGCC